MGLWGWSCAFGPAGSPVARVERGECAAGLCKINSTALTSLQLQNSKAVIQSKDATIQELKEKIAYLEAEVCVLEAPYPDPGLEGDWSCLAAAWKEVSGSIDHGH